MKQGQITIYVILGVILVGLFFLIFFLLSTDTPKNSNENSLFGSNIQNFVESCFQTVALDSITYNSERGGYYDLPPEVFHESPYYVQKGKNIMPTLDKFEKELSTYVENEIGYCLDNFSLFKGVSVEQGEAQVTTTIKSGIVSFSLDLPLRVSQGVLVKELQHFEITIESNLGNIISIVEKFIQRQESKPEALCISCLKMETYSAQAIPIDKNTIIEIQDENVLFKFVVNHEI